MPFSAPGEVIKANVVETVAFGGQLSGPQRGWSPKSISLRLIMQSIKQCLH